MPESVACNLCGASDATPLFRLRDHRFQVDEVDWTAVRCRRCGLGYLDPRPTPDESERYYPPAYFALRRSLVDRYERQVRYLPRTSGRLLDVGAGDGGFLRAARKHRWDVVGIEPFGEAADVPLIAARFDEAPFPDASFDVVTAWASFEHLHDPARAFAEVARVLRPGGTFVLQVPNLRSVAARIALQEDVPRHLYFFEPRTLRRYGERVGLRVLHVDYDTELFGGSGRGALRLLVLRAFGWSVPEFFAAYHAPRGERFRGRPALRLMWNAAAAVESVLLADRVVRTFRVGGEIVVRFVKEQA